MTPALEKLEKEIQREKKLYAKVEKKSYKVGLIHRPLAISALEDFALEILKLESLRACVEALERYGTCHEDCPCGVGGFSHGPAVEALTLFNRAMGVGHE